MVANSDTFPEPDDRNIVLVPDGIYDPYGQEIRSGRYSGKRKQQVPLSPEEWKPLYLEEFARTGNVLRSATFAGVDRRTVYYQLQNDPEFKEMNDLAREDYNDVIRGAFHDRAIQGTRTEREIWMMAKLPNGAQVPVHVSTEVTIKYSDQLLIAYAKSRMRAEYGEDRYGNNPMTDFDLEAEILRIAEEEQVPPELIRQEWERIATEVERSRKNDAARRLG